MPGTDALRARNHEFWAQAAPGWIRHADRQDKAGRPLGAAAMEWLRPQPGERILDVGCGCGGTTAELAAAAGPGGEAVGVDLSDPMVAAARRRFPRERHPGLRFVTADIETVRDVPGAPYDAVFSRMALMLQADPVAGCTTIRRSLRRGGRLAATVFRDGGANPWMFAATLGAAPHVGPLPPVPMGDEPGPFAFADPGRVRRILTAAGFDAVTVQPYDVTLDAPDEGEPVAEWLIEMGPAGPAYRAGPAPDRAAARAAVARLFERFREPGAGYRFPAGIWLVTAETAP
ncbi:class I SAM-dependent methyltransferase [Nonomuraea zeae]|uniref:Methyltransferase domain-containing protein n=1 Tax=Nonomuraea zeae TaxID=1642303 RepID=A0A5S4HJD0_9ACTN|nr:class I SAM-dependent methyltransferase [Nonomuraea zeae]TMR39210.1 methyltransferase domain-containing protein [Nonomuraea zeae]